MQVLLQGKQILVSQEKNKDNRSFLSIDGNSSNILKTRLVLHLKKTDFFFFCNRSGLRKRI